jgi:hypothetical protein
VRPIYNCLYDVYYPVIRYREKRYVAGMDEQELDSVSMHGYLKTMYSETKKIPVFQIYISYMDEDGNSAIDKDPDFDCFTDGCDFDLLTMSSQALGPKQLVVAPLVNRNNAGLFRASDGVFGVLMPLTIENSDELALNARGNVAYFSPSHIS